MDQLIMLYISNYVFFLSWFVFIVRYVCILDVFVASDSLHVFVSSHKRLTFTD